MESSLLQGRWTVLDFEDSGDKVPQEIGFSTIEFAGEKLILEKEGAGRLELSFRVFASTRPKSLEIEANTPEGNRFFMTGIYAFEGDLLRVCWNDSGHGRPTTFETNAQTRGLSFVLKRVPAAGE